MNLNRRLMLLTAVFSTFSYTTQAQYLTAKDIYNYAQSRNYYALSRITRYIDIQDNSGNTALCLAVIDDDYQAYNLLRQYGANPQPYCLQSAIAASNSSTFLGMGTTGWLTTGAIVAIGAGVAVAVGGGGGSGGSSSSGNNDGNNGGSGNSNGSNNGGNGGSEDTSATKYLDNEPITDTDNGQEIVGKTALINDPQTSSEYLNNSNNGTIKKVVQSQSAVVGIASENTFVANALSFSGNNSGDIIISQRGSGDIYGIKGPQGNYVSASTDDDDDGDIYNAVSEDGNAIGNITIRNTGAGKGNIYGMQSNADDVYIGNAMAESELNGKSSNGTILIENIDSDKNVYGISSNYEATNAESDDNAKAIGNINIKNKGNGNVYGIKAVKETYNADATDNSEASARIDINNVGNGDVYGVVNEDMLYNAQAGHYRWVNEDKDAANASATINIENTGTGNAYGLKSSSEIYNVYSYYNSNATGKIRINNNGNGNAYGMYGSGLIKNADANYNAGYYTTAKGYINLLNKSYGNVYGIYSDISNNHIMNINRYDERKQESVIEIANIGNRLAVGIYSKDGIVDNSGDIKIHNLANGTAVGIYADGTTAVTNSGNITIDRESYTDDMATDITSDDVTYTAKSTKGGKAIGIYGAADSSINNSGTIRINGADTTYGIYSEGGNVTNTGTILIDGKYTENAIKLNGSKLLQDGVLIAGTGGNSGDTDCEHGTKNGNTCICDEGWSGEFCDEDVSADLIGKSGEVNNGNIVIDNVYNRDVYGIASDNAEQYVRNNDSVENASINIKNKGNGDVYGVYGQQYPSNARMTEGSGQATIDIDNQGNGNVYGVYSSSYSAGNAVSYGDASSIGRIKLKNSGQGNSYGIYGNGADNVASNYDHPENVGIIDITNEGSGNAYGIYSSSNAGNAYAFEGGKSSGKIRVDNQGNGSAYGIYGNRIFAAFTSNTDIYGLDNPYSSPLMLASSTVDILNRANGNVYGLYGSDIKSCVVSYMNEAPKNVVVHSLIEIANIGNRLAVGMYSKYGTIDNSGDIRIHNLADGVSIGIYADIGTTATNSGTIIIDRSSYTDDMATDTSSDDVTYTAKSTKGGKAIGIYGAANSSITNTGTIKINGAEKGYGIWSEGSDVTNTGTILIDGAYTENAIRLSDSRLLQDGVLIVDWDNQLFQNGEFVVQSSNTVAPTSLNLNDFGGTVVASDTSKFIVEGAISGDLAINNNVIENGFDTTYRVDGMIEAADVSGLNLQSQSVLFDAALENNTDAVMTMKAFNDVVDNSSLADFLQNNYALANNEKLFTTLKGAETVSQLNSNIDDLFGKDMFSQMAFEDLSMVREVNFDMNNRLFEKAGSYAFGGNVAPSNYDNSIGSVGRYSLNGFNDGKRSFGLGVSITDIRTYDGNNDNSRFDRSFMMSAPMGYKTHGFELISAPKLGYANGNYDRDGFEDTTYKGKVEKRMFALMNEARYPVKFAGLSLTPSAEFNMIGYNIKGHEDEREYSLRIKSQNHYSVEAGFGLMAEKEFKPLKNHKFSINGGLSVYHEFANPYELKVGMNGMNGTYTLRDDKRSDNRAVARFGFGYELGEDIEATANLITNIDREYRTDAGVDVKYHF